MTFLEYLKQSPECLYLYDRNLEQFGVELTEYPHEYLAVVNNDWNCPDEYKSLEKPMYSHRLFEDLDYCVYVYNLDRWFDMVLNNNMFCWECSCSNKKYIIKEHVKLLLKGDSLKLRRELDAKLDPQVLYCMRLLDDSETYNKARIKLFELIRIIKFSNQIIENHKIINLKECKSDWNRLINAQGDDIMKVFFDIITSPLKLLHNRTDDLLKNDKIKRAKKCVK